jgi:hypothetical protein
MQTPPVRLPLPPGTTAHQLMAQGMPESSAYRVLHQGWYFPAYNQRDYPQHDGPGGFATIETPERFVRASVLRTLAQWEMAPSPELVEDLTQEGLLACWTRRHAPHIQNFPHYYAAMLRGLVTQHCKRLLREQAPLVPLQDKEARHAVRYEVSPQPFLGRLRGRPALMCHRLQKRCARGHATPATDAEKSLKSRRSR